MTKAQATDAESLFVLCREHDGEKFYISSVSANGADEVARQSKAKRFAHKRALATRDHLRKLFPSWMGSLRLVRLVSVGDGF